MILPPRSGTILKRLMLGIEEGPPPPDLPEPWMGLARQLTALDFGTRLERIRTLLPPDCDFDEFKRLLDRSSLNMPRAYRDHPAQPPIPQPHVPQPSPHFRALAEAAPPAPPPPPPPPPAAPPAFRFAHVGDVRRGRPEARWIWPLWIPGSSVVGVAASEGTGKTRFLLDLARRIYHGEPWPDGHPPTLSKRACTLWVCADGHQDELAELLPAFGLPDEALIFPAGADDPYQGTDIDDPDVIAEGGDLERAVRELRPALVIVDSLTNATSRDLCSQAQMKLLKSPLVRLAQQYSTNVVLSMHLNREGQALGRRIRGVTRTLLHLERPDPQRSERLRLWVEKSYDRKPPPLGVTQGQGGNTYDEAPPAPAGVVPHGPVPEKRLRCEEWLREQLAAHPVRVTDLRRDAEAAGFSANVLYACREGLGIEELLLEGRKWWSLPKSPDEQAA